MIRVTIFNEFKDEKNSDRASRVYPEGIHTALKDALSDEFVVRTVILDDIENGLTDEVLENTDVLIWWGHKYHNSVPDEVAQRVRNAVLGGMGAIFLHSAHHSKPFRLLMGTACNLTWREDGDREYLWVTNPAHPIAQGLSRYIKLDQEETYGEPFSIPNPDEIVFIANFEGGEVIRAGCCYRRENGKIFYFQPGHETYPTYYNKEIIQVIKNAVKWATSSYRGRITCPESKKPN